MSTIGNTILSEIEQEKAWVEAARRDPQAFQNLFDKYHDRILNYALRRTCNLHLAQDITASAFMKALDNIHKFTWRGVTFSAWIYRIATNEINQNYRKIKRMTPLTPEISRGVTDDVRSDNSVLRREEMQVQKAKMKRVYAALAKLKPRYQTVLSLRYFENKSIKEIAEILELPENTIKTHIRRGLIQMREQL